MDSNLLKAIQALKNKKDKPVEDFSSFYFNGKVLNPKVNNEYRYRRDQFIKPEYDFPEIAIAEDVESIFRQAVQKKINKILSAGFSFVSQDATARKWILKRIREIEIAGDKPFKILMAEIFLDMFRFYNCMLLKVRNEDFSSGKSLKHGKLKKPPIAAYFLLRLDRTEFQINKNGTLKKVLQRGVNPADDKEFSAKDIIHIYAHRKPGFLVGTPEVVPVLDDMRILRRIEENVIDLIETNLFPLFHYQIGSDKYPEKITDDGRPESARIRDHIERMAASGFIVSDHRHSVNAVGSESKALRIDYYLNYFRERVLSGLAISPVDLGMGNTANRSTASSMSKSMLSDIEAMTLIVKEFIDFYILSELLEEGGFNSMDPSQKVEIKFGVIDKDERRADENQVIQTFTNNVITLDEARHKLQEAPFGEEEMKRTHMNLFQIPVIEAELAAKERVAEKTLNNSGAKNSSTAKAKPKNQHGTRSAPKTNKDIEILGEIVTIACDSDISIDKLNTWKEYVVALYQTYDGTFSLQAIADTTTWRLHAH